MTLSQTEVPMAAQKKNAASEKGQEKGQAKRQDKGNGPKSPSDLEFTRDQELQALRDMLLIRRFEEKAGQLYGMGAIGGVCQPYIGQEAKDLGMQQGPQKGDQGTHR